MADDERPPFGHPDFYAPIWQMLRDAAKDPDCHAYTDELLFAADEIERLREREQDLRMHAEQDACEIERLRTADNLLNRAERLIAAGDKLAQGVLDEHQPFQNDQRINLWWLVANWQEARRG